MACDTAVHQGGEGPISPECREAESHSDFAFVRDVIFRSSCVFSSCHGAVPNGRLSLTASRAHDQLVGVTAHLEPTWVRVVPGSPDESYLMVKLGAVPGPLGEGGDTMPLNNPLLCEQKVEAVRRWIAAGASSE